MVRFVRLCLELVASLVGIIVVLGLILVWRLNDSPMSYAFLTPYIETALDHIVPGTQTQIGHSVLSWDNIDYSLHLQTEDVRIYNLDQEVIGQVPSMEIQLSLIGVLLGRFVPIELIVNHPQFMLKRREDGQLYFGEMSPTGHGTLSSNHEDVFAMAQSLVRQLSYTRHLNKISVAHAALDIQDEKGSRLWSIEIPDVSVERVQQGLNGHINVEVTQKDETSTLELNYSYDRHQRLHQLSTSFDGLIPAEFAGGQPELIGLGLARVLNLPLTGNCTASFDENLRVHKFVAEIEGAEGELDAPDLWERPRHIQSFNLSAHYDHETKSLRIEGANIDFGGPTLQATLIGVESDSSDHDLDFTLDAGMKNWPMDQFSDLWPKPIISNARTWIIDNLTKGIFNEAHGSFKGKLAWNNLSNLDITEGQGQIMASHGNVHYIDGLPSVENVNASGSFDLKQMNIQILSGGLDNLKIAPFTAVISGLDAENQFIDIPLKVNGPIPDVLKLIDHKPLGYAKAVGLATDALNGNVDGEVDIHLPLLKSVAMKDVDIKVAASLQGASSSKLIKNVNITQGNLALLVDKSGLKINGSSLFDGISTQVDAVQSFEEVPGHPLKEINIKGVLRDDQWSSLGVDALKGSRGNTILSLSVVERQKNAITMTGMLDFTAVDLHIDQANWKKSVGVPALLKFSVELPVNKDIDVKSFSFHGGGANIKGNATLSREGELKVVNFNPLIIGRTDTILSLSQPDLETRALRFDSYGRSLDISGLRGGHDPARSDPRPKEYHLKADKIYTSDTGYITDAEGFAIRDLLGWSAIELHGNANGGPLISMELKPENDVRVFSMSCENFGEALKALGVTDSVQEGEIKISGRGSPDSPRIIEGNVHVSHFDAKNLPVLMLLLNATSPFGFSGILTDTVSFDRLKGEFRWEGDVIDLKHMELAGNSVGMNVAGRVDMDSAQASLQGTLVPFSTVNSLLGSIPLLGDIITGGDGGGILAVTYSVSGSLNAPKVSVNPVSLLTPGFLRNIFFDQSDASTSPLPSGEEKGSQ